MLAPQSLPQQQRHDRAGRPLRLGQRLVRQALGVSLYYKVLLANGLLVLGATLAGMALVRRLALTEPLEWEIGGYAAAVLVLSLLVNAVVLRAAFHPIQRLEETADAVRRGDQSRRAPRSLLSDPAVGRLIDTFNAMLDAQEWQRAELGALSSRTLDAQEEERRRIARELHDETAQELTALLVRIRLASDGSREPATRERLAELRVAAARTLDGVRRIARELRPTILDDLGLTEAIRAYAQETVARGATRVEVRASGLPGRLSSTVELVLYRVAQEALSNVAKHAEATRVEVTVAHEADAVVATIADNGRGFAPLTAVAPTGRGLGLLGMRERLALVGGDLEIDSHPGAGTTVRATVPLAGRRGGGEGAPRLRIGRRGTPISE